jgi:regulatory protein
MSNNNINRAARNRAARVSKRSSVERSSVERNSLAEPTRSAFTVCIDLLSRREHSAFELKRKLLLRSFELEQITKTLEQLQEDKLQSDLRFAASLIYRRMQQGYGPLRIRIELKALKVASELIAQAMADDDLDWQSAALRALRKKPDLLDKPEITKFLLYRGFSVDMVESVMLEHVVPRLVRGIHGSRAGIREYLGITKF